jgi:hypothetical protein
VAILSNPDRAVEVATLQRDADCPGAITKADLRAAFDAIDGWWETTGAALANAALPLPARTAMTTRQKAKLFTALLRRRYEVS